MSGSARRLKIRPSAKVCSPESIYGNGSRGWAIGNSHVMSDSVANTTKKDTMRHIEYRANCGVRNGGSAGTMPDETLESSSDRGNPVGRTNGVREMLPDEQPRERMLKWGSAQLKTSELIAILLNTGTEGESVIKLSERIL